MWGVARREHNVAPPLMWVWKLVCLHLSYYWLATSLPLTPNITWSTGTSAVEKSMDKAISVLKQLYDVQFILLAWAGGPTGMWPHQDQCGAFTARGGHVTMQQHDCLTLPPTWKPRGKRRAYFLSYFNSCLFLWGIFAIFIDQMKGVLGWQGEKKRGIHANRLLQDAFLV